MLVGSRVWWRDLDAPSRIEPADYPPILSRPCLCLHTTLSGGSIVSAEMPSDRILLTLLESSSPEICIQCQKR